jgi:hypothetical protein
LFNNGKPHTRRRRPPLPEPPLEFMTTPLRAESGVEEEMEGIFGSFDLMIG